MATRYANNNNNTQPLPTPPLSSSTSPRRSRGISFGGKSEKSHRSHGSNGGKISLHETPEEKAKRVLHTKADPTLAMNEAQPSMVAALEKSNLGSLRSIQHKDQYGNVITDPDLSNPTRPRFERPLDTIRSFEAAIDGSYHSRRMSYVTDASQSRPTSYYGGNDHNHNHGRPPMSRPDSYIDYGASGSNGYSYQGQRGNRPRHGNNRMNSEYSNGNGYNQQQQQQFYPNSPYQRSNDNFTAGSGSANTDQWGNSTDPSSVNSSFDRLQQQAAQQKQYQQQQADSYGFNGFGGNPDTSFHQPEYHNGAPPPPPHGQSYSPANGTMSSQPFNPPLPAPVRKVTDDDKKAKRGSWFKRRFSKD